MELNRKIVLPVTLVTVTLVAGSWLVKGGKLDKLAGWHKADAKAKVEAASKPLYTCSMHPFILKDAPGSCPICGMTLIKKIVEAQVSTQNGQGEQTGKLGAVSLSPVQSLMANVATTEAKLAPFATTVNAVGIVQYDQSRQAKVTAWTSGRLDKLHVSTVGAYVSKGKPIAEMYSPDLVAAQQEYLLALKSREQLKSSSIQAISQGGEGLVGSARQRLKLLGVRDEQIAALEKAGEPNIRLSIYTPLSGVVIEKMVQQGQYVDPSMPLFSIADLSRVWVEAEVYENEFPSVKVGQAVEILSQSYPGVTFRGRVAFVYPFLDPKTRTVKVRVELPNPGLKLKPDMYVNAAIKAATVPSIVVPVTAVIDTGNRQVVWVEQRPGSFVPREVRVGAREGGLLQIVAGLKAGERVASSGGYLIDSEAQLTGAVEDRADHADHAAGARPAAGGGASPAAPAVPATKGGGMSMDDMKM